MMIRYLCAVFAGLYLAVPCRGGGHVKAAEQQNQAFERCDLARIRAGALAYSQALSLPAHGYGAYRSPQTAEPNMYASCDVAIMRTVMGEDLHSILAPEQREQWINHINSYAGPDGTYQRYTHHSLEHANGMVIGALGVLGGRQKYSVRLYDAFDTPEKVAAWLEKINWREQWSGSHLFWGGMHVFSMSRRCTEQWRKTVFDWLDANLDPETGWWRKGVRHSRSFDALGGGAHIWPIYQHHGRRFPFPERVIDSILAMQQSDGSWLQYGSYMELDALYGLAYMSSLAPTYRRQEILKAVAKHGRGLNKAWPAFLSRKPDLHVLLGAVGAFGLLQQWLPDIYYDNVNWTDIFSDKRFYQTGAVERL